MNQITGLVSVGKKQILYDLQAAVLHHVHVQNGHFSTVVEEGDCWLHCDDARVSPQDALVYLNIQFCDKPPCT